MGYASLHLDTLQSFTMHWNSPAKLLISTTSSMALIYDSIWGFPWVFLFFDFDLNSIFAFRVKDFWNFNLSLFLSPSSNAMMTHFRSLSMIHCMNHSFICLRVWTHNCWGGCSMTEWRLWVLRLRLELWLSSEQRTEQPPAIAGPGITPPITTLGDGGFIRTSKQLANLFTEW